MDHDPVNGYRLYPPSRTEEEVVQDLLLYGIQNDACIECHLAPSHKGKHYVTVGGRGGKKWRVTRLVWRVLMGKIADDIWVLHSCDNPACININHLFLGTAQDNTNDMMKKGRWKSDPEVGQRRRAQTAELIKACLAEGMDNNAIARKLRLSRSTVWNYTNGPYRESLLTGNTHTDSLG